MTAARDSDIRAAIAARETQETKIAQKVLAAHREAFRVKWPSQLEHCLRLATERLQACLTQPEGTVLHDPVTWPANDECIRNLAMAVESLYTIHREVQHEASRLHTSQE